MKTCLFSLIYLFIQSYIFLSKDTFIFLSSSVYNPIQCYLFSSSNYPALAIGSSFRVRPVSHTWPQPLHFEYCLTSWHGICSRLSLNFPSPNPKIRHLFKVTLSLQRMLLRPQYLGTCYAHSYCGVIASSYLLSADSQDIYAWILMYIYIHIYVYICPYIKISIFILGLLDILITE